MKWRHRNNISKYTKRMKRLFRYQSALKSKISTLLKTHLQKMTHVAENDTHTPKLYIYIYEFQTTRDALSLQSDLQRVI